MSKGRIANVLEKVAVGVRARTAVVVEELDTWWGRVKEVHGDIDVFLEAVEDGDDPEDVLALMAHCAVVNPSGASRLPGGHGATTQRRLLRYARAQRRRERREQRAESAQQ